MRFIAAQPYGLLLSNFGEKSLRYIKRCENDFVAFEAKV